MNQELELRQTTVAVREPEYTPEQWATLKRLVKLRPNQPAPHQEELKLMVQEAAHLRLDPFAGECYFINFGDGWVCYPHWTGLMKIAEYTGDYEGHEGPFYSDDGETWVRAWVPDRAPKFCMVRVFRAGHKPTEVVQKYSRVSKNTPQWRSNPEEQLAKSTLRLAIRRAFWQEADKPLSPRQLKALHTLASIEGFGGEQNRPARLATASEIIGRPVESFKELSVAEATELYATWAPEVDADDETATAGEATGAEPREEEDDWKRDEEVPGAGESTLGEVRTSPAPGPQPVTVETLTGPQQVPLEPEPAAMAEYRHIRAEAERQHRKAVAMATTREFLVGLGGEFKGMTEATAIAELTDAQLETLTAMLIERLGIPA